jgi:hypothetical protein
MGAVFERKDIIMGTALRWLYFWLVAPGLLFASGQRGLGVFITTNTAAITFPQYIKFQLDASSEAGIQKVALIYGTDQLSCQPSSARQALDFEPDKQVSLQWKLEFLSSGVIPPGAEAWWQWEITDGLGNVSQTEKQSLLIQDGRFEWHRLKRNGISIQWYQGPASFGQAILDYADKDLKRLSSQMDMQPTRPIWITVYASTEEMRAALVRSDSWAGAVALPEYGSILLGLAPSELNYADYYIAHELTHLVVGELIFNCQGVELPTWLNEGLADNVQGKPSQEELDAVVLEIESQTLPALSEIARGFSADGDQARLEYTQSNLAVEYLLETYRPEKMIALLAAFKSGLITDEALLKVYGMDTTGVDTAWRKSLGFSGVVSSPAKKETSTLVPTLALWTSGVRHTGTPTATPEPTATRTAIPSASPVPPASTAVSAPAVPAGEIPGRSPIPYCSGALMVPVLLVLFLIGKKESVK